MPDVLSRDGGDILLRIKVVPGASRDEIAGILGDRLRIRVSAPPERGRANKAVCALLASVIGVKANDVAVTEGRTSPLKVVRITGGPADTVRRLLGELD